jgi:hypothetical protein
VLGGVVIVDLWVILFAVCLVPALAVAAVLLWVGTNALLHGRGFTREAAITIASLRRVLRSIYDDTARESLPDDFLDLLGKLKRHRTPVTNTSTGNIGVNEPIVAIGLLTERQMRMLGPAVSQVWPIEDAPGFKGLLEAIDEANRRFGQSATPTD